MNQKWLVLIIFFAVQSSAVEFKTERETIIADRLFTDKQNNLVILEGNVTFSDPHHRIVASSINYSAPTIEQRQFDITGKPLLFERLKDKQSLSVKSQSLSFRAVESRVRFIDKVALTMTDSEQKTFTFSAQQIVYRFAKDTGEAIQFDATGAPATLTITDQNGDTVSATCGAIKYNQATHEVVLSQQVDFQWQGNQINADKIIYNDQKGTFEVPKSEQRFHLTKSLDSEQGIQ